MERRIHPVAVLFSVVLSLAIGRCSPQATSPLENTHAAGGGAMSGDAASPSDAASSGDASSGGGTGGSGSVGGNAGSGGASVVTQDASTADTGDGGQNPSGPIKVDRPDPGTVVIEWADKGGARYKIEFNVSNAGALLRSIATAKDAASPFVVIAQNVDPRFRITAGMRKRGLSWPYIFADHVDTNLPAPVAALSTLTVTSVSVESDGPNHLRLVLGGLSAGQFSGDLVCHFYHGSPFVHFQAAMKTSAPWVAYIYDALFYGAFDRVAYLDVNGVLQSQTPASLPAAPGNSAAVKTRRRTIVGTRPTGALAVFPGPHTGKYPTDKSVNFGFNQAGQGFIGTRMDYNQDTWRPWVDAPQGQVQKMDAFVLLSAGDAQTALDQVSKYTNGDSLKALPGYYTMAEHFHGALTVDYMSTGTTAKADLFKSAMVAAGINIVHLLEFHGDGNADDTGTVRLEQLRSMFELCRLKSEAGKFLFLPGEEYNHFLGGHWAYMFPHAVFFTIAPSATSPYKETIAPYGTVYRVKDAASQLQVLRDEGAIGYTAHPRTKSSERYPDTFTGQAFYRESFWQAGDWKALPADLSKDRLGSRSFKLMDDTAQWGIKKFMLGATDTFALDPTHDIYANLSVNYLKMSAFPPSTDWSSIVDTIRNGKFFTTTGEVLIHDWSATDTQVTATVEWYFPPAFAQVTWGDDAGVHQKVVSLSDQVELDKKTFTWSVDLASAKWVRLEVWDIARNGAFTQPAWIHGDPVPPPALPSRAESFTLIDTDTDLPVPGYDPMQPGQTLSRANLPPNLSIRANTNPLTVSNVQLVFDNAVNRVVTGWPYSLGAVTTAPSELDGTTYDYAPYVMSNGMHTIIATPNVGGVAGKSLSLTFSVTN
jgi:hypothetical protein